MDKQFRIFLILISIASLSNQLTPIKYHLWYNFWVSVCNVGQCRKIRAKIRCGTDCETEEILKHPVNGQPEITFSRYSKGNVKTVTLGCKDPNTVVDIQYVLYMTPKKFDFCTTPMDECENKPYKEGECSKPKKCVKKNILPGPNETYTDETCDYNYKDITSTARLKCLRDEAPCLGVVLPYRIVKNYDTCGIFDPGIKVNCSDTANHCFFRWIQLQYTCPKQNKPGSPVITAYKDFSDPQGDTVKLKCSSSGGLPLPTITWSSNNETLLGNVTFPKSTFGATTSTLTFKLNKSDDNAEFSCSVENSVIKGQPIHTVKTISFKDLVTATLHSTQSGGETVPSKNNDATIDQISTTRKNTMVPIIVGIVVVLLIGGAAAGGVFYFKKQKQAGGSGGDATNNEDDGTHNEENTTINNNINVNNNYVNLVKTTPFAHLSSNTSFRNTTESTINRPQTNLNTLQRELSPYQPVFPVFDLEVKSRNQDKAKSRNQEDEVSRLNNVITGIQGFNEDDTIRKKCNTCHESGVSFTKEQEGFRNTCDSESVTVDSPHKEIPKAVGEFPNKSCSESVIELNTRDELLKKHKEFPAKSDSKSVMAHKPPREMPKSLVEFPNKSDFETVIADSLQNELCDNIHKRGASLPKEQQEISLKK